MRNFLKILVFVFVFVVNLIFSCAGTEKGKTEVVTEKVEAEIVTPPEVVRIQGGTFMMGSPKSEEGRVGVRETQHRITVSSFYMGKYEVTQKEYSSVMGENPSRFKGDNLPVESVSWYEAIEYCNKRSLKEGLTPAYTKEGNNVTWNRNANGYRLPTEAEWEYACRAGTTTPFNTGKNITIYQANFDGRNFYTDSYKEVPKEAYREKTTPVGSFAPNKWGLCDMHGNVDEWCWDWYIDNNTGDQKNDPVGPISGYHRVSRGGSWHDFAQYARSAYRYGRYPDDGLRVLGFRLVRL